MFISDMLRHWLHLVAELRIGICDNAPLIYDYSIAAQSSGRMSANVNFYICIPFLYAQEFDAKAPTDGRASESKFKAHCLDRAVCPSCMYTACNSMYLVRAAAVCIVSKEQKHAIWNAPYESQSSLDNNIVYCDT